MSGVYSSILALIAVSSYINVPIDGCTKTTTGLPIIIARQNPVTVAATSTTTTTTTAATTLVPCVSACPTTATGALVNANTVLLSGTPIPCDGVNIAALGQTARVGCPGVQAVTLDGTTTSTNTITVTCTAAGWDPDISGRSVISATAPLTCMTIG